MAVKVTPLFKSPLFADLPFLKWVLLTGLKGLQSLSKAAENKKR